MLEWVRGFVIALGGGTVVLIGMLTICKGLFIKFFESGIESSFEKSLERFKNKMERSTRAYEILLDREMGFYERISIGIKTFVNVLNHILSKLARYKINV